MTGFELIIGDKSIKSALKSGGLSIMVSGYKKEISLLDIGGEENSFQLITWYKADLTVGDALTVNVVDINDQDVTEPLSISESSTRVLIEEYNSLKKELDIKDE